MIDTPTLATLPWEYLFDDEEKRFLALSADVAVIRHVPMPQPIRSLAVTPPLRVLAVFANPADLPALDVEREKTNLRQSLAGLENSGHIQLDMLENGTMTAIGDAIRTTRPHVFHFVGHGVFENETAYLILEDAQGVSDAVDEHEFSELFEGCYETRLVVLNACETGVTSVSQPLAGMAPRLLQRRIGAVVAMQAEILDDAAIVFGRVFYQSLTAGYPVDAAIAEARRAISQSVGRDNGEWGVPVSFLRARHGRLFDIIEVELPPRPMRPPHPTDFIGREAELAHYAQQLKRNHVAIISGMAGVGKSALAATLVRRLADENQIFWHIFHEDEGADVVLWKLGSWLAWRGHDELWRMLSGNGQSRPAETHFDHLLAQLTGHGFIICLDDFHHVDDDPLLTQFVERLLPPAARGEVALVITTRHRPPSYVKSGEFAPLGGLTPADSEQMLIERGATLSADQAMTLHSRTGGNATMLNLAIDLLQRGQSPADLLESLGTVVDIKQYLLEEVDAGLDEIERDTMQAVAVLSCGHAGHRECACVHQSWRGRYTPPFAGILRDAQTITGYGTTTS